MKKFFKVILVFSLLIVLFIPLSPGLKTQAASMKKAVVDVNGSLNVRSGPNTKSKIVGSLKNKSKLNVYSQTKSGWSEIRFKNKKAYVSTKYLRFYSKISSSTTKKVTDKVISAQRKTWKKEYTKKQIYSIMSPHFTKSYIDKYFKQHMRNVGKNSKGTPLYFIIETELFGYLIEDFHWKHNSKKPTITYYVKNGKQYLSVSQWYFSEISGNHTSTLYLTRSNSKSNWKVYKYKTKYD